MKTILFAIMVMAAGTASAAEVEWRPVALKCSQEIVEHYDCGVDGYVCWPKIFECTAERSLPVVSTKKTHDCEEQVNALHPRSSDDPVKMAMTCVLR